MPSFQEIMNAEPFRSGAKVPGIEDCRRAVRALIDDIQSRIFGQDVMVKRLVQGMILQKHVLIEGLPGEGKTRSVRWLAKFSKCQHRWVQGRPDLVSSDLSGKQVLRFRPSGEPRLKFIHGPVYSQVLIMDEVNRSPGKAKAVILQVMQDKVVDRPDKGCEEPVIPPEHVKHWKRLRSNGFEACYGIPLPDPQELTRDDVRQIVVATQNPIEMEGTYPLPEAQLDRFTFFVKVIHPEIEEYPRILHENLALPDLAGKAASAALQPEPQPEPQIELWQRMNSLFDLIRLHLFAGPGSLFHKFEKMPEYKWLRECVQRMVNLTRWRIAGAMRTAFDNSGASDPDLRRVEDSLNGWLESVGNGDQVRERLHFALTDPKFEFVERGSSVRGLIDWVAAAIVEAFLKGDEELKVSHFRATAHDTLTHRVALSPQAATEGVTPEQIIDLLLDALLPEGSKTPHPA